MILQSSAYEQLIGMPSNRRQQTVQSSTASGSAKSASKPENKNGSKMTSVPKGLSSIEIFDTLPTVATTSNGINHHSAATPNTNGSPNVNRKKQKRREKEAAKRAAADQQSGPSVNSVSPSISMQRKMQELEDCLRKHSLEDQFTSRQQIEPCDDEPYYSDEVYSGSFEANGSLQNDYETLSPNNANVKKSKKKRKSKSGQARASVNARGNEAIENHVGIPLPSVENNNVSRGPGISKEKIWNTSSQEERERIKEFWLSLGEDERKSLVKVEKDAVLKKMKEQQKHSCSCTVCGRKRTAIEEELEVLYDAYYEELEQYANHQGDNGHPMMPPPRRFGAMSGIQPPNLLPPVFNPQQPSRGRIVEQLDEDDDEDGGNEEYSEDEVEDDEDDDYSEDEPEEIPRSHAADFFNFGNSLTVQGGILTVADDLLKNDGKKFIEMMEQLAERRMAREEDAREQFTNPIYVQPPNTTLHSHSHVHNHPAPPEEEDYDEDEEDEEEYDSQDEDYDEEELSTMTEEQRMEEGRRMFQIFAARMFEQRVLTAYKKKVSEERTQRLLEELEEETRAKSEKQAKKARDAQKKKEKLVQKKLALAEEKARREAEEAEKLAAIRQAEEKRAEEARIRAELKRKKKEALKKAEEEERLRKEAEKVRRVQEQRERQAEQERKQREAKGRERKEKDEQRQKDKEAKEAKEREAKERREKTERERQDAEVKAKAEKEHREKQRREECVSQRDAAPVAPHTTTAKRPPIPIPVNLQPHQIASPHIPVATPAISKAPTPIKFRKPSQQDSSSPMPHTPQNSGLNNDISPLSAHPQNSPGLIGPPSKAQSPYPFLHQPQATSPMHAALKSPPGILSQPNPFGNMQSMNVLPFPPGMPIMGPGFGRLQHEPVFPSQQGIGAQFRPIVGSNGIPLSINMHQIPQGRGFPIQHGPPGYPPGLQGNGLGGIGQAFSAQKDHPVPQTHSRQQSGSLDISGPSAQPIARPAPIGRPASIVHGQHSRDAKNDVDDLSNHLGSSALLDDSDEPINSDTAPRNISGGHRQSFVAPFGLAQPTFPGPNNSYGSWGAGPSNPFGPSSLPDPNLVGGWPSNGFMVGAQNVRLPQSRSVGVRLMICRACKNLECGSPDNYNSLKAIKDQIDHMNPPGEVNVSEKEILDICETEGNSVNGGGSFEVRDDGNGHMSIRFESEISSHRPLAVPGEIGSPIISNGGLTRFPPAHPPHWY
ncbi:BgTH12-00097 [Blumeria graminis f. sp. triticale]|uniref:Stress response protein NST1 n=1 Tax=Blumeria graminis f. sp. triticale TaxID=1689686 RepID=A0A9W4D5S9_BLUGR|nr:BgTH12-00097 [Blumeria graminis f. sp. triticale]